MSFAAASGTCPRPSLVKQYKDVQQQLNNTYLLLQGIAVRNYQRAQEYYSQAVALFAGINAFFSALGGIRQALSDVYQIDIGSFPNSFLPPLALTPIPPVKAVVPIDTHFDTGLKGVLPNFTVSASASLRASATLAFLIPARLASRMAQLLSARHPLSGLVRMMWAAS